MYKFLILLAFLPFLSVSQSFECTTIVPNNSYADTIFYCVTDASCHDLCDGSITINVVGDNQPYSFSWSNGASFVAGDNFRDSLCANQYIISIIDVNGNLVNNTYVNDLISPPNFTLFTDLLQDPLCFDSSNGQINLSIGGATPPYSFSWDDGTSSEDRTGLNSGVYYLTTSDINSCIRLDTFELFNPAQISSSVITDTLSCIGACDGTGIVIASNGVEPYQYQWNNNTSFSNDTIQNLCFGANTITIIDSNGCIAYDTLQILNPDTLQIINSTSDSTCFGTCDGQLSVTISGGKQPYFTQWIFEGFIFNNTDTITDNNLCYGDYQLIYSDANDCIDTISIPLIERDSFVVQDWIIDDSCYNSCTGQITVQLMNPESTPISYNWSNGSSDTVISNLCNGFDTLSITDSRGCVDSFYYYINEGDSLYFDSISIVNNTCFDDQQGAISLINFGGGVLPIEYTWSNGQITNSPGINALSSGFYSVDIEDALGCTKNTANILVDQPDLLFNTISSLDDVSCFGASDGLIDISIFGGVEPYFISWNNILVDSNFVDSLSAGQYIFTIVDDSLCTLSDTILVDEPDLLVVSDSVVNVLCKGDSSGFIYLFPVGGTSPYEYSIDNGINYQSQSYFDNLIANSYSIIIRDANGCLFNLVSNVIEPISILSAGLSVSNLLCFGDTTTIQSSVNGGTPTYSYLWNNGVTTNDLNGVGAGNYLLTIIDDNGCEILKNITLTEPDEIELTPNPVITNLLCFQDGSGAIDLSINGGVSPFTYLWNNGSLDLNIANLNAGNYQLTVTDNNNCVFIEDFIVDEPNELSLSYTQINVDCFGNSTGEIDITVAGGTPNYSYSWSNLSSNEDLVNIPAGTYDILVSDLNNCTTSASILVNQPSEIIYSVTTFDLICNNQFEGEIIITASGGVPGYTFSIDGGLQYQNSNTFMSLPSDNYFVFIQDANLCLKSESFSINQPSAFSPIVDVIDIDGCYGDATGAINFSLSGNTPPYSYSWSNNQTTASISDLSSGDYEIIVNDDNNCQMTYSYFIDEPLALELSYTVMPASCEEKNDGAINTFVLGGIPPILYQWGSGEISSDISDISIGNYSLYVEDAMGCSLPIELIEVGFDGYNGCIEIPSGFTPNNDNIHDEWVIYGLYDFPNTIVKVYNRWGQEVFSSNGYNVPWDGKYNGVDLPTATYYYVIELNDSDKVYNGTVTIKR